MILGFARTAVPRWLSPARNVNSRTKLVLGTAAVVGLEFVKPLTNGNASLSKCSAARRVCFRGTSTMRRLTFWTRSFWKTIRSLWNRCLGRVNGARRSCRAHKEFEHQRENYYSSLNQLLEQHEYKEVCSQAERIPREFFDEAVELLVEKANALRRESKILARQLNKTLAKRDLDEAERVIAELEEIRPNLKGLEDARTFVRKRRERQAARANNRQTPASGSREMDSSSSVQVSMSTDGEIPIPANLPDGAGVKLKEQGWTAGMRGGDIANQAAAKLRREKKASRALRTEEPGKSFVRSVWLPVILLVAMVLLAGLGFLAFNQ